MTWNGKPIDGSQLDVWVGVLTALGTLAAVVVAVWLAVRSESRARVARREATEANEKVEAALVSLEVNPDQGFLVTNNSGLPIRSVRVHAADPNPRSYRTTVQARLMPGGRVMLVPNDRRQPTIVDHHAVMFQNHFDHWWASFAGGELLRLPDDEEAADSVVIERLTATIWSYLVRTNAEVPGARPVDPR